MSTTISILSDQLIPNVLFIKQMGLHDGKHIFLSTAQMRKKNKSSILADALEISESQYQTIEIDPNSPKKINQKLLENFIDSTEEFLINITGGTKMMSQMTYEFFRNFPRAKIYYWPIEFNYVEQLYPNLKEVYFEQQTDLDLKTYLAAYGYTFTASCELSYKFSRAEELYTQVCKKMDSGSVVNIQKATQADYTKEDKKYLTGGWFEEWLYGTIKKVLNLADNAIAYNLKLKSEYSLRNTESDNEIDIAFVYKNTLYIVECKVFTAISLNSKKITDAIYKISSIRQSMGLKATALVCILAPFGDKPERKRSIDYLSRMAQVKEIFSLEVMVEKEKFINQIKKIISYE